MASPPVSIRVGGPTRLGSRGLWSDARGRFRRDRLAMGGLAFVAVLAALALAAPLLAKLGVIADPYSLDTDSSNAGMSAEHPLGADYLGRDLLSRMLHGARISLSIALLLQTAILLVGGTIGLLAGYLGGRLDNVLMRVTDVTFAFPDLLFVLVIASVLGAGYWNIVLAVGAVNWVFLARLVRGEVRSIKPQDYVQAARAGGSSTRRILLRHVVPNSLGPVIVTLTFGIPSAIFIEAFLSFVGVGVQPPTPSWGIMIDEGYEAIFAFPHQILVPAVAMSVTMLAVNFVANGLRDALDPHIRR